ncbi:class I SAM-dependent RNA methyltransferase [Cochlodiniinecator piscidefendens]|uniref:class I SAM-dependent RNA methyltransferase n=1 Tax=Cochlodiniinecator piscidefendens TaxID=2715756 RepID=UPI001407F698|nr:RsmD family RNA methyltransferase [Cochlodiniinecator piscidefendens]
MKTTIERLGHQGDAIAAGPIFVTGALPGEEVEGDVVGDRMIAPKIITPSADRVKPPCSHAKSCGGCSLQHASDAFVEDWKQGVVDTALIAQGVEAKAACIKTSPPRSRRRASLSGKRTKKGAIVGFHGRASGTVIEVPNCTLLHPDLMDIIPVLQEMTVLGASRKGEASFTIAQTLNGVDVLVRDVKPADTPLRMELAQLAGKAGLSRLTWEDELIAGRAPAYQMFGKASVAPPPGAFLQATREGEQALLAPVLDALDGAKKVVDLFAGSGTFSLPAAETAEVHAVESEGNMLSALDTGWRQAKGLKRVTTETRDLFRRPLMPDEFKFVDAVIIDPPRAGAEAQIKELAKSDVPVIAMVSCNPVTFARDARLLVGAGYSLGSITVVDQFRWSPHVELVASFTKPRPKRAA